MYDDLPTVSHTVDAQGFVLVDGARVLDASGKHLKLRTSYDARCQRCVTGNVVVPLRVVCEWRNSLGRVMYFHAGPGNAFYDYRLCEKCKRRETTAIET